MAYDPTDGSGLTNVAWAALTSIPAPIDQIGALSCANGEILKKSGGVWTCAADDSGAGGEVNTATNIGTAGVGVYANLKVGPDLRFRNINAGSAKVSVTNDAPNNEIDIDVNVGATSGTVAAGDDSRFAPAPGGAGNAGNILRVSSAGTAYEQRTAGQTRDDIGAAARGPNSDITSLTGLTTALSISQGGTGLNAVGGANKILGMNTGNTAMEYKTITGRKGIVITHSAGRVDIAAPASTGESK